MATRRQPERAAQAQIVAFLRGALRAQVYVSGTTRRRDDAHHGTMQTPGIPDLEAFVPMVGGYALLKIEVKAPKGRLSLAQVAYRTLCQEARVEHVVGGLDEVIAWALTYELIRADQVAHYRVPRAI